MPEISLSLLFTVAYVLYALFVIIFLIMDRRSPASTFAWLFFMLAFPLIGLFIYMLTGRSWRAFSRENYYVRRDIGAGVRELLLPLIPPQKEVVATIKASGEEIYKRLIQLGRSASIGVVTTNNSIEILQDAVVKYPLLIADIENATHSIHLEYFMWTSDVYMQKVMDLLVRKAQEGVEVRLLYDAVGCFGIFKDADKKRMRAAAIEVEAFSPILRLHTISYRNHRKIVVIDGRIGYMGGLNMGEEHLIGQGLYKAWRDTHLRVEGEQVRVMQAGFVTHWYHATMRSLLDKQYFVPVTEHYGDTMLQLISSGPDSRYEAIRQMYFYMITSASHHVYVQSPFFILDASLIEGLKAAALSGVDVRIMLAPFGTGDNPIPYWAAYTYILEAIEAGVKVYLYQPGYMHAKTVMTDSLVCSIGSANMDIRSFNIDYEINCILYDAEKTLELEAAFMQDLEGCVLFNPAEYKKLPFNLRFRDAAARLLSPLL